MRKRRALLKIKDVLPRQSRNKIQMYRNRTLVLGQGGFGKVVLDVDNTGKICTKKFFTRNKLSKDENRQRIAQMYEKLNNGVKKINNGMHKIRETSHEADLE